VDVSATAAPPTSPSGRMVLGDDVRLRLGPDALTELSRAIDALRSDMTRTEDQPDR
jgi:hypothetical protein